MRTVTFADGLTAEAGMEELWAGTPAYGLLDRLGLAIEEADARSSLVLGGRLHPYDPARPLAQLDQLLTARERRAADRWIAQLGPVLDDLATPDGPGGPAADRLRRTDLRTFVAHDPAVPRVVAEWVR